jgi:Fe-Mn family superoxide dismutase
MESSRVCTDHGDSTSRRRAFIRREETAMTHELPKLPYPYDALEPVIDRRTMELHHDKHHRAYVDALNAALAGHAALQNKTIESLLRGLNEIPAEIRTAVRNQGGGHANHRLFWKVMAPPRGGGGGEPTGDLAREIERTFGSFEAMRKAFEEAGAKHFGSGWVSLTVNPKSANLEILTLPNQDSVLTLGKSALLMNDLWEHAYYLKHYNARAEYLKAWWGVVNWRYVGERLQGIREGKQQFALS